MNALGWTFKFFLIMKEMENWDFMSFYTYFYVFGKSKFKNLSPFLVDFFMDQKKLRIWTYLKQLRVTRLRACKSGFKR